MKNVKYVIMNFICFLMMSLSIVVFGSDQNSTIRDTYAQILNTDEAEQVVQQTIRSVRTLSSAAGRTTVFSGRTTTQESSSFVARTLFASNIADRLAQTSRAESLERSSTVITLGQLSQAGRDTLSLELQARRSERRQSAQLAERIRNLNIFFADQVGGLPLSEEQKARRVRERCSMEICGRWTE